MRNVIRSFRELTKEEQLYAGGKGGTLARLYQANFPVPEGFVIMPTAFIDDALTADAWKQVQEYLALLRQADQETAFAIRSSALAEDSVEASFAGEFETVLNVQTDEEVHQAICTVYQSRHNERVQAYSQAKGISATHEVAVVVQQLIRAESAGVMFTANPVTGNRDQVMISASWGLGEAIVGGLVTPDLLITDKASGSVINRKTADKNVMTVLLGSGTGEQPTPEAMRRMSVLTDEQTAELVGLGNRIEQMYGMPMDIEWTLAKGHFAIVQARPITTLPEPDPPAPTVWKLPKGSYVGMRNNIVELMADPLTPLFGTLGRSAVNTSMHRQMTQFFGRSGIMPDEIIVSVNDYAYYNGSIKVRQMARILMDSVGIMKRMFTGAVERWTDAARPRYFAKVEDWQAKCWRDLSATEILSAVRELAEATIDAYMALVSGVLPAAWISEALFTIVYKTLIKRRDDPTAPTYLMGFNSIPIQADKSLYDLAEWARARAELTAYLSDTTTGQLASQLFNGQIPSGVGVDDWHQWHNRFQAHLQQYGHAIYNLDFSTPVPADDPAPLLDTLKLFISGQGVNPHIRQQTSSELREQATRLMQKRLKGLRLKLYNKFIATAQRFAPLREDGLADVGLGYPLLRKMLRELGNRFVAGGMIETPDDIFWLKEDEVKQAADRLDRSEVLDSLSATIPQRKAVWRAAQRATPPMMLPQIRVLGKDMEAIKAARVSKRSGDRLEGVAASPGRVTAPARVILGPADFDQMQAGDVLVAAITTPAWTPLFVRAAGVVTDVGGPLSHGSIVAREYGIPAVLGTGTATKRIRSGQMVTVDGSEGKVYLEVDTLPKA